MNRFLLIILLLLSSVCSFGQTGSPHSVSPKLTETDSLYLLAVEKYIVAIDSFFNQVYEEKLPKTIFIEYQHYLSNLPDSIDGYRIQMIGVGNRKKVFRANKKKLRLIRILPLTLDRGKFCIVLAPYLAELKSRNRLHVSSATYTVVLFEFKKGRLRYEKTEHFSR